MCGGLQEKSKQERCDAGHIKNQEGRKFSFLLEFVLLGYVNDVEIVFIQNRLSFANQRCNGLPGGTRNKIISFQTP